MMKMYLRTIFQQLILMSIEINSRNTNSRFKAIQLPLIRAQSLSVVENWKENKAKQTKSRYTKIPSQPSIEEAKKQQKQTLYKKKINQQLAKKSTIQLKMNQKVEMVKQAPGPQPIKFVKNYHTVDLWKTKYAYYLTKPSEPTSQEDSIEKSEQNQEDKRENKQKNWKQNLKIPKQVTTKMILKNSPNTKFGVHPQFSDHFQVQQATYSHHHKKTYNQDLKDLKEKTITIFSKYKKGMAQKKDEEQKKIVIKESMIPTSWEIRTSQKEEDDLDDILRQTRKK